MLEVLEGEAWWKMLEQEGGRGLSLLETERLLSVVFSLQRWRGPEDSLWVLWVSPP